MNIKLKIFGLLLTPLAVLVSYNLSTKAQSPIALGCERILAYASGQESMYKPCKDIHTGKIFPSFAAYCYHYRNSKDPRDNSDCPEF